MPNYDYKCEQCGDIKERFTRVDEYAICGKCKTEMKRLITTRFSVIPDIDIKTEDISGKMMHITSRKQLKDVCKKYHVEPSYGKGWY